jgi:hypothetical protein
MHDTPQRLSVCKALRVSRIELGTPVLLTEEGTETPQQSVWLITKVENHALTIVSKKNNGAESLRVGYVLPFGWVILIPDPMTGRDCFNQAAPSLFIEVYE